MADGLFYNDLRVPFSQADGGDITLSSTDKALYVASAFPVLGGNYWSYVGKRIKIRMFGKLTTAATPGNGTWDIYWGSGADANGTIIVSSTAEALTANQTTLSWELQVSIHCRTIGTSGTLFGCGWAIFNESVKAVRTMIPAGTAVASATMDLTTASIVSVQFKRSGSTAEHMWYQDLEVIAMN